MVELRHSCPDEAAFASLVAGGGTPEQRAGFVRHVASCDRCRNTLFERQNVIRAERRDVWRRLTVAVSITVCVTAGVFSVTTPDRDAPPGGDGRVRALEGRLAGHAWAPYRTTAERPAVTSASMARSTHGEPATKSAEAAAARAVLRKLRGVPAGESSESAYDARDWSDLAAVYISQAGQDGQPQLLVDAIAAADAALELDARLPEARFNRALAIERLGLRDAAANAWRDCLEIDSASAWAREAAEHLQKTGTPLPTFEETLARDRDPIAAGDRDRTRLLLEAQPLQARMHVELDALPRWGEALASDPHAAREHLAVARSLATELRARGDGTLLAAIETIERSGDSARAALARAHALLVRARAMIRTEPTRAEPLMREAAGLFSAAGSDASMLARYYAAVAAFEQNRRDDAARELRALDKVIPSSHRSVRALVLWQLGLCEGAAANWGTSIRSLERSIALFDEMGETMSAAFVRQIASEVYDAIGDRETSWMYRAAAIRDLGGTTTSRTRTAVAAIAYDAAQRKRWRTAVSMLNLEVELARFVQSPQQEVQMFLRRAVANAELGRTGAAAADLAAARHTASTLIDPAQRARAGADTAIVDAIATASPHEAIEKLTGAIAFHQRAGREMFLPALHLRRARAYIALGDGDAARADLDAGIARLERTRESLPDPATRFGIFDTSDELFAEAIGAALARNDTVAAFRYNERSRARALLDLLHASSLDVDAADFSTDTAVVAFAAARGRLVIFVAAREAIEAVQTDLAPAWVRDTSLRLRDALERNDSKSAAITQRLLYEKLVTPIEALIERKTRLVFAPGAETASLPFAALRDAAGRYLMERYTITVAPSAAVHLRIAPRPAAPPASVLVVAASNTRPDEVLTSVRAEARAVAAMYADATVLTNEEATADAFASRAPVVDAVHFAGHASSAGDGAPGATLLGTHTDGGTAPLTIGRIEALRLSRAPVVVLAACSTARGEVTWSEGPLSIARAFVAAGASNVIATLWPIDDSEAAEFFPRVHHHMTSGLPPPDALRATQLEWSRRPGATPSLWSAVQSIGR